MTNNIILLGLIASVFVFGYLGLENAIAEPNGTPFIQAEIDAIEEIIQNMQTQLDGILITWPNLTGKPAGFADDVDNDTLMEISVSCTVDQIVKWDGIQWNCADSANNQGGGDLSRKLDCLLIRESRERLNDWYFQDGCDLTKQVFNDSNNYRNDLSNTNLSYAVLTGSAFDETNLEGVDFTGANLAGTLFYNDNLVGADFTGANLSGAEFLYDNLEGADFTGANLSEAKLQGVNIDGAIFTNAYADPPCTENIICDTLPTSPPS